MQLLVCSCFYVSNCLYMRVIRFIFYLFVLFILLLGLIPQIRGGNIDNISFFNAVYFAVYDPFAMFNGLKYYLINNGIDYFNYPIILFSKIIGIIPTHLMPNKSDYYTSLSDIGVDYIDIQAAWHTFPMLMIHFGIIGSILLAFISPIVLQYLKK